MRHPVFPVLPVVLASILGGVPVALAQRYADERVPLGPSPGTAATTKLVHGDVDGDGWDELVVRDSKNVDWVLRGGPGGFTTLSVVDASNSNDSILVDLNGDGRHDLLTQKFVDLGYYRGQPNAMFVTFVNIQAKGMNEVFWTKRAADVNADGKIDVVASLSTDQFGQSGVLRWFAGNGAGAFGAPNSTVSTPYPYAFELADFNLDGFVDAAASGPSGNGAFLFAGTGTGFAAPVPVAPSGTNGRYLATGDFDADGIDDLALFPSSAFTWFRGGAGGLTFAGTVSMPGSSSARDLVAADLEHDGADDLLLVEGIGSGRIWSSHGAPGAGLTSASIVVNTYSASAAALEFDGKPGLDLAYTAASTVYPTLRASDGAGGFLAPVDFTVGGACPDADSACAGDIDRDGALDLAFESGTWLRGAGDGTFAPAAPLGASPSHLVDLNDDGRLDAVNLLTACGGASGLNVALAAGSAFGPTVHPPQAASGTLAAVTIGDLDGDGDVDLATVGATGAFSHLNDGAGGFASFVNTTLTFPPPTFGHTMKGSQIAAGDLNGDGRADLAIGVDDIDVFVGTATGATIEWGLSAGNGQLTAQHSLPGFNSAVFALAIEDTNGDALADIVFAQTAIYVLQGDGAGNATPKSLLTQQPGSAAQSIAFADVDGDGLRDVIGGGPAGTQVTVSRGTGAGYTVWRQIAAGGGAGKLLPYDFDADGRLDLAWGNGGTARFVRNLLAAPAGTTVFGTGTFGCLGRVSIGTAESPEVGNSAFRVVMNHLPPHGTGWLLLGSGSSLAGLPVGVLLHVDPLPPAVFLLLPSTADSSGEASLLLPIPADPTLAGFSFTTQAIHSDALSPGAHCSLSPLNFVSSRGLTLSIQP